MGDAPPPFDRKEFIARIGTFLMLVGFGLMVFFFLSNAASRPRVEYFCWGTILLTFAFVFRGQFKKPAGPPHGRFSIFQRLKAKPKPKEEKPKEEKKK